MLFQRKVNIQVGSRQLGTLVAQESSETQTRVLTGFAEELMKESIKNNQPIISLVSILSESALIIIAKLYYEAVKQGRIRS